MLVTIGGGSLTDGAKAVVLVLALGLTSPEQMNQFRKGKKAFDLSGTIPLVCVPTTLSGGEFTPLAGVTNTSRTPKRKEGFEHRLLQPTVVIFDPMLTRHTPEWLFLSTGIRAVDHCIEGICSIKASPYTTAIASAALRLLGAALLAVKKDPLDMTARSRCQQGVAIASSIIMQVPFGASHAIGHVLGGTADVPHGYTSCVNLPYVLEYNSEGTSSGRLAGLKGAMVEVEMALTAALAAGGVSNTSAITTDGSSGSGGLRAPAAQLTDLLIRELGMPRTLSEVMEATGTGEEILQQIAVLSMRDPWTATNPRPISTPDGVMEILQMALRGRPSAASKQRARL
jgi:maleylacetate reductase